MSAARKDGSAVNALLDRYRSSGFFVLRTPLLPVAELSRWSGTDPDAPGRAPEPTRLRRALTERLADPPVADGLRVASPTVADNVAGWLDRPPSRRRERMERTLVQYYARMCDRCTPFGLFAGVSVGEVGGETRLRLAGRECYRRRSALDLEQVSRLVRALLKEETVRKKLRYRPNDTLAAVPGGYQYVEAKVRGGEVRHEIAFLEADEALSAALEGRSGEPEPLSDFHAALAAAIADPEVRDADIEEYLDDLIEAQVLLPELIPAVVGADPLDQIIGSLEAGEALSGTAARVRRLREELDRLDAHGVGAPPEAYAAVDTVWSGNLGQKMTERLLQVDMFKEAGDLRLSGEVVDEVLRGAEPLLRLAGPAADSLRDLKNRFRERYESREVPLAEAFDPERGLGAPGPDLRPRTPGSPLLAGLDLGAAGRPGNAGEGGGIREALAERIFDWGKRPPTGLELDDDLLERLAPPEQSALPDALSIQFDLLAESEAAVRRGDYRIFYHGGFGPSGARMLGRFSDLDPVLLGRVRAHLRAEEKLAPDSVFAEIVHTPEGRVGNVVRRPHVRKVELSCAGHSRLSGPNRLTVDDLLLRLEGGRFRLRSRRDGRTVVPRLTSAHNFRRSSGMYRFLCALQNDGTALGFGWSWGSLNGLPFLPRVTRGRAIYSLARWKVGRDRAAYKAIGKAKTPAAREDALRVLVREVALPRFVRLADGDNRLLLDLENPLCLAVLADHAARRPALTLTETLAEDLEGCVSGPEGKYRNEIILPLVRTAPPEKNGEEDGVKRWDANAPVVRRVFTPGDEWLYYKLYAAPSTTDRLLGDVVAPLAALHEAIALGEPWFFIRYGDPEHHVRVRFRGGRDARRAMEERMSSLLRPFVEAGSIHRVSLDTYVREVERYGGGRGIEIAESWFRADSSAALRVAALLDGQEDEALRWKAVAMGWDRLLADFGLDYAGRERVVTAARESFGREFRVGPAVRRRLAKRLRAVRRDLEGLMTGNTDHHALFAGFDRVFRQRSEETTDVVRRLRDLEEAGDLGCPLDELLRSFTHMHANRLFPASARAQELVIHDFLSRTYRSLIARIKQ